MRIFLKSRIGTGFFSPFRFDLARWCPTEGWSLDREFAAVKMCSLHWNS